ncbi:MAG TPA: GWxTD domain-containing protein [Thermoanaerobaculia bacterium]|jgi:GWxTD domain-containing protein|nr:GWxTD domain-containing protein [Thermoanaerobaculia bacterium]
MARGDPPGPRLRTIVSVGLFWLTLACQSSGRTSTAAGLADGPTRWLMLPDELRQVQRMRTNREAVDWLETFWRRRDPTPEEPGNERAKTFYQRVEAADRLYSEGGLRGSLTPRGRSLILLGPPPVLRYTQKRVPSFEPGRPGAKPAIQTREVVLESWVYAMEDLEPAMRERMAQDHPGDAEVVLVFLVEPRRTELLEGEKYLDLAVRSTVRDP